ncbi:oxidoreductase [Gluconobacter thailandicus]|uniref:SDR family oxidoreductase n=1 Tax=Gluconobacter thailandicus TaxID=257438 RepID=UPI000777B199|nr:SDR family oxidoreductase [Gluconobacter thailandicus]KXV35414.1 oxidoreductase [Gluconobacter thailandicus]
MTPSSQNKNTPAPLAFVTGATGLLGNNLVRALLAEGFQVRALARSEAKARQQFERLPIEIVSGDLHSIPSFSAALSGVDVLFHTAAYFRDSYTGGNHAHELEAINVKAMKELLDASWKAGIRRMVHASSIAVLKGAKGQTVDETMLRRENDADPYFRSKIRSERVLNNFLADHPEFWACMVLPGWMHGPGDRGPTSAGQTVLDVARGKLPGLPPGSVSLVDARDVALAMIACLSKGKRGERYLAAGRHLTMTDLIPLIARLIGRKAPTRPIPMPLLYLIAALSEVRARLTRKPVLMSWATAKALASENDRSHFSAHRFHHDLGLTFRPLEETLTDEINWFRKTGFLP